MRITIRRVLATWIPAAALAVAMALAAGACSGGESAHRSKPAPREDFVAQAADFRNLHTMTKVRNFYIDNRLGHLDEALAVANSPTGGVYPVGTVIDKRGTSDVVNRFGGNCASCHQAAQARFDGVCEENHGCAPLPIGPDVFHAIQESDPRPS